ncbi:MAG: helix-turn-helix domain-containing protein, partial [Nitrospirota bacterium]
MVKVFFTVNELAEKLRVSKSTIYQMVKTAKIPYFR